ncbi:hypothetical protein Rctr197k_129 [Virus Rctr197k]|nr:hypothetical protein Rctr197k_129 [Virus Rctr197k]
MSSTYAIQLTFAQIIALVDIALNDTTETSPRWDGRTLAALADRRGLISVPQLRTKHETKTQRIARFNRARLTKKGEAYLEMARYEYRSAEEFLEQAAA